MKDNLESKIKKEGIQERERLRTLNQKKSKIQKFMQTATKFAQIESNIEHTEERNGCRLDY